MQPGVAGMSDMRRWQFKVLGSGRKRSSLCNAEKTRGQAGAKELQMGMDTHHLLFLPFGWGEGRRGREGLGEPRRGGRSGTVISRQMYLPSLRTFPARRLALNLCEFLLIPECHSA